MKGLGVRAPHQKSAKLRLEAAKVGAKINDFHWGHLPCSDQMMHNWPHKNYLNWAFVDNKK